MSEEVKKKTRTIEVPEGADDFSMAVAEIAVSIHEALLDGIGYDDAPAFAEVIKDAMDAITAFMPAIDDARADQFGTGLAAALAINYAVDKMKVNRDKYEEENA